MGKVEDIRMKDGRTDGRIFQRCLHADLDFAFRIRYETLYVFMYSVLQQESPVAIFIWVTFYMLTLAKGLSNLIKEFVAGPFLISVAELNFILPDSLASES